MPRRIITRLTALTDALASLIETLVSPAPEPRPIPIRVRQEHRR